MTRLEMMTAEEETALDVETRSFRVVNVNGTVVAETEH